MDTTNLELLVVSDTHGNVKALTSVLTWAKRRQINALAFLGDGADDVLGACAEAEYDGEVQIVRGNGDFSTMFPLYLVFHLSGRTIFLCHGHTQGVAEGLHHLLAFADGYKADVILFGHTHRVYWSNQKNLLVLNPGSLSKPRDSVNLSFATIRFGPERDAVFQYWKLANARKDDFKVVEYHPKH